jgi:ribosomal protein L7/L12
MNVSRVADFAILLIAVVAMVSAWRASIADLQRKFDRLADKLDLLLKANGIDPNSPAALSDRVRKAVADGRKIEAIKLYREETGLGLREAKDAVDKIMG